MVTYIIIGITVLASLYAWSNEAILAKLMFNPYEIKRKKQYYRFLTSGFIHADSMHLLFNMMTLYFFGASLESKYVDIFGFTGEIFYVLLYISAMIVSDLKSYFQFKDDDNYRALGASGAVSAALFASILFAPLNAIYLFFIPIPIPGFIFGVLYLIYSYFQGKRMADNVGHDAHFYGAIFGILFTIGIYPEVVPAFFEQIRHWSLF